MGVPPEEECFFDTWDHGAHLTRILDEAKAFTDWIKGKPNRDTLFGVLVLVDDWASDAQATKIASFLPKVESWAWFLWKTVSCRQHRSCFVHIFIDSTGDFVKCV